MAASKPGSDSSMVTRYHPLLVALHWLLALLIVGNLAAGFLVLEAMANSDPAKLDILRLHMLSGITIGVLMVARIVTRLTTKKPGPADGGRAAHVLAGVTHWGFYLAVFGMVVSGLGMAQLGGLFPLLSGQSVVLPDFETLPPYNGHAILAIVIAVLFALHLAGVIYHQLVKDEPLTARMWFGPRK